MEMRDFFEHISGARRVYGEPYERDGATVIPAVSVRAAGGFGTGHVQERISGGTGGGGATTAGPVGAYVIRDGKVSWEPAIDVNRIVLGGQILLGLALIVYALRSGMPPERRHGR
ncbi:sporulation protein [Sphaerisporangium viridialbum]|uniref:sporulation protein n=1 Tax=Sphaerisporangium viridialbum TaxID=46189 RepID=UPI003C75351E